MAGRAVITGIGVVAPSGVGTSAHWRTTVAGRSQLARLSSFDPTPYDCTIGGELRDFDASEHVDSRLLVQTDRWTWTAFAAAAEALNGAGIDPAALDPYAMSVVLASSSGGNVFGQRELQRLWGGPTRTVGAYQSIAWFYAASVGQLSIRHQMKGPSSVLAAESAGGLDSFGHAARTVQRGTPVVLAGGTEAPLSPYALACQQRSGALSTRTEPARAYLPFDADATGYVPGEGGAVFVVEDLDHALSRRAPSIVAEIIGWAATHDGAPTVRNGEAPVRYYARAMRTALDRAGVRPGDVDVVFPDALGVPAYDLAETAALREVFGESGPALVTTQKPLVGRLHQGGAALDVATALLGMQKGVTPMSAAPTEPAPGCELAFARTARHGPVEVVMVNARGYDGFNSSLVLRRHDPSPATNGAAQTATHLDNIDKTNNKDSSDNLPQEGRAA
jgi:minimal PKS chain-length factor (CLF/KS beta)